MTTKTMITACIGLVMMTCSTVLNHFFHSEALEEQAEAADKQQLLQAYFRQEFEKVVDPALGRVPTERLQPALKEIQRRELRQSQLRTASAGNLTWTERGPNNIGGRTRALLFDKNDATHKKVWVGSVSGGLWFTNDITATTPIWSRPANADQFNNLGITTIAQHPTNPLIMYFGTGEGWYNYDGMQGGGIWKTVDGGVNWTQLSNTIPGSGNNTAPHTHFIQKIVVTSNGTVLAATEGAAYCNVGGIYRSTNDGSSWSVVRMPARGAGTCDNLGSSHTDLEIGADGSVYTSNGLFFSDGVYRSADHGATWTKIFTSNASEQRIEIATAPNDANYLYIMTQGNATNSMAVGRILRSTNATAATPTFTAQTLPSWTDACSSPSTDFTRGQATYDLTLAVDPNQKNTVYAGGIDLMRSTDGGANWTQLTEWWSCSALSDVHGDQHSFNYVPNSSTTAYATNDGGVYRVTNANSATPTFTALTKDYNVAQFYAAAIHPTACSNNMLAGSQDNGTQKFTTTGINSTTEVTGGDGAFCHIDKDNPNLQISSYIYNKYRITNNNWSSYTASNIGSTGTFINPTEYDDVNNLLYTGHNSGSYGVLSGGLLNGVSGISTMVQKTGLTGQVGALKVDPNNTNTLWIGSTVGTLHKITNPNGTPTLTILPSATYFGGYISCIDVEKGNSNHLLVTVSNYGVVSVRESTDGGATWNNVEGNLPDIPVRWGIFNPLNPDQALLATELGVFSTDNLNGSGTNWVSNNSGLAKVRVDMLKYRNSDYTLVAATHGRGLFTTTLATQAPASTASVEQNMETSQVYLGANADVYCYSSTDGQLIARIKNLSAHDYGCTSIAVTRSSAQSLVPQPFTNNSSAQAIAPKTFQITPTNNNATGNYQLTLYFTAAEVTAWENYTGKRWEEHGCIAKCSGNILNVTPANPAGGGSIAYQMNETASKSGLAYITTTFNTGFSSFGMGAIPAAALPLELLNFTGALENQSALLYWTTAQEKSVLGFDVERSMDQKSFEKIGFVAAQNQVLTQSYAFNDNILKQNIQYYRLKMKDIDGSYQYSKVIAIQTVERNNKAEFVIAPNPVQSEMQLIFSQMPNRAFDLRITDMTGRQVYERHYDLSDEKTLNIPMENVVAGNYIVTVRMPNGMIQSVKMRKL
jgi:Secretion system C-terminal sorting domain